jgi:hypothetical protein
MANIILFAKIRDLVVTVSSIGITLYQRAPQSAFVTELEHSDCLMTKKTEKTTKDTKNILRYILRLLTMVYFLYAAIAITEEFLMATTDNMVEFWKATFVNLPLYSF